MNENTSSQLLSNNRTIAIQRRAEIVGAMLEFVYQTKPELLQQDQSELARLMGLNRPDVSRLLRGDIERFSIDRLIQVADSLGARINVQVFPGCFSASPACHSEPLRDNCTLITESRKSLHNALRALDVAA